MCTSYNVLCAYEASIIFMILNLTGSIQSKKNLMLQEEKCKRVRSSTLLNQGGAVIEGVETNCSPLKLCSAPWISYALCHNCYPGALTKECISNQGMTLQKLKRPISDKIMPYPLFPLNCYSLADWPRSRNITRTKSLFMYHYVAHK